MTLFEDLNISHCLKPVPVRDGKGILQLRPCGKCVFCTLSKCLNTYQRAKLISSFYPYGCMLTLTYRNSSLPVASRSENGEIDVCRGNGEYLFHSHEQFPKSFPKVSNFDRSDCFGVLVKKDIQLFIKRLRENAFRYFSKNKGKSERPLLKYFYVGEYGPGTYRPHFHVLFYTPQIELFDYIRLHFRDCWSHSDNQFHDFETLRGDASSYVSNYVASAAQSIYSVFDCKDFRQFHHGSKISFSEARVTPLAADINRGFYDTNPECTLRFKKDEAPTLVLPRLRDCRKLFPVPKRFSTLSTSEIIRIFLRYDKLLPLLDKKKDDTYMVGKQGKKIALPYPDYMRSNCFCYQDYFFYKRVKYYLTNGIEVIKDGETVLFRPSLEQYIELLVNFYRRYELIIFEKCLSSLDAIYRAFPSDCEERRKYLRLYYLPMEYHYDDTMRSYIGPTPLTIFENLHQVGLARCDDKIKKKKYNDLTKFKIS